MNTTSLAIINTQAPFSISNGKDALDMALIFGSYEQQVALFFIDDGVYQLLNNYDSEKLSVKDYTKTFAALNFYDIEHVYVCNQSLIDRQIKSNQLIEGIELLSAQAMKDYLHQYKVVLTF